MNAKKRVALSLGTVLFSVVAVYAAASVALASDSGDNMGYDTPIAVQSH
ncbi:hypothetical protein ACWDRB_67260 [Nonomuraea sp. NPDC003707]